MLTPENLQEMPEEMKGDRFAVMEHVKGIPVSIQADSMGVFFLDSKGRILDCPEVDEIYDIVVKRLSSMYSDTREIIMEQHRVCDLVEGEGQPANRPEIPRDFQKITIKAWIAGGEYPDVPAVFNGEPKGKPYYCQDVSLFAYALLIDDVEQDIYQMGALCGSYGIPFTPIMAFVDGIEEAMYYSASTVGEPSIIPSQAPLLDAEGKPQMTPEGYFQNLPVVPHNTRFGNLIRSVQGRGLEHYVAHLN